MKDILNSGGFIALVVASGTLVLFLIISQNWQNNTNKDAEITKACIAAGGSMISNLHCIQNTKVKVVASETPVEETK